MLLQAAIGFGIFLMGVFFCLVFVVFPGLMIYTFIKFNNERKRMKPRLTSMDHIIITVKSLFISTLIILGAASIIYLILYLTVDLSIS